MLFDSDLYKMRVFRTVDITSHEGRVEMFLVEQAEKPRQVYSINFLGTLMVIFKYLIRRL